MLNKAAFSAERLELIKWNSGLGKNCYDEVTESEKYSEMQKIRAMKNIFVEVCGTSSGMKSSICIKKN